MEQHRFAKAIYDKLFLPEGNRLVVAVNRDGYLATHDCCLALEGLGVLVYTGDSLALRLVRELEMDRHPESRILFVTKEDFRIMDDIAAECDKVVFLFRSFFKHYSWDKVTSIHLRINMSCKMSRRRRIEVRLHTRTCCGSGVKYPQI